MKKGIISLRRKVPFFIFAIYSKLQIIYFIKKVRVEVNENR